MTDIALDLIDSNPHAIRSTADVKELAARITARGVLQPILAVRDGERFITVDGHHRVAAARVAGLTVIPALVFDTLSEADQVADQLIANDERKPLTTTERANGYQSLLDLGMSAAAITKATGAKKSDITAAATVSTAKKATVEAIDSVQPSLEEAAALVEFEDDERALGQLMRSVGSGSFKHNLSRMREKREQENKRTAVKAELKAAGIPLLTDDPACYNDRLGIMVTRLDAKGRENHDMCPGHCAVVGYYGDVSYYCSQPTLHGKVGGSAKTDDQKALDRAKREGRAAWKAATVVRIEAANGIRLTADHDAAAMRAALAFLGAFAVKNGLPGATSYGIQKFIDAFRPLSADKPVPAMLALAFGQCEWAIDNSIKYSGCVIGTFGNDTYPVPGGFPGYIEYLVASGYTPADCERAYLAEAAKVGEARRIAAVDAGRCDGCDGDQCGDECTVVDDAADDDEIAEVD